MTESSTILALVSSVWPIVRLLKIDNFDPNEEHLTSYFHHRNALESDARFALQEAPLQLQSAGRRRAQRTCATSAEQPRFVVIMFDYTSLSTRSTDITA